MSNVLENQKSVFLDSIPNTTHHYNTLFGGTAFFFAAGFSRKKGSDSIKRQIDFTKAIHQGTIIELIVQVQNVGNTSCVVRVEIYKEGRYNYDRELAVAGKFTFVAIEDMKNPISIIE